MKSYLLSLIIILMVCVALPVAAAPDANMRLGYDASPGTPGVQNTHPHNLSSGNTGPIGGSDGSGTVHASAGGEDQVCKFCHTPHGGSLSGQLWNRKDPVGPFPLYAGALGIKNPASGANYDDNPATYPNGSTRLCLSCHDWVTAVGEVINRRTLANLTMTAAGTIDLSTSHPVSFDYTAVVAGWLGGGYQAPAAGYVDAASRVQCTTCHDPHTNTRQGVYSLPMWRWFTDLANDVVDYDNTCLACHTAVPAPPALHGM